MRNVVPMMHEQLKCWVPCPPSHGPCSCLHAVPPATRGSPHSTTPCARGAWTLCGTLCHTALTSTSRTMRDGEEGVGVGGALLQLNTFHCPSPSPPHRTPLHCSASCSNLEMVQYLIHNGASVFMKTVDGQTPLRVAFEEFEDSGDTEGSATSECLDYLLCEWGREREGEGEAVGLVGPLMAALNVCFALKEHLGGYVDCRLVNSLWICRTSGSHATYGVSAVCEELLHSTSVPSPLVQLSSRSWAASTGEWCMLCLAMIQVTRGTLWTRRVGSRFCPCGSTRTFGF